MISHSTTGTAAEPPAINGSAPLPEAPGLKPATIRAIGATASLHESTRRWWTDTAPWYAGKLAKRKGSVRIDGGRFEVSSPVVSTYQAGLLALGRYEVAERAALRAFLDPELALIDCGASIGVVSCLANARLHHREQHLAVEANPAVVPVLEANRALNQGAFSVVHAAIAYGAASVEFGVNADFLASSVGMRGGHRRVSVPAVTVSALIARLQTPACTLLCDIEGMELELFRHDVDAIRRSVRCVMFESHLTPEGIDTAPPLFQWLNGHGFSCTWSRQATHVFQSRA